MKWTDPQVEMLSRLWLEGMTATQIAAELGGGITRNAVIGKVHRLGLSGIDGIRAGAPMTAPGDEQTERTNISAAGGRGKAMTNKLTVTIADLSDGMCRWPADEPTSGEFRYCGETTSGAGPYCARHGKLAYQPTKPIPRKLDRHSLFPSVVIQAEKM